MHGHVDVRLPNGIANRHAKEFSVEVAGSAEMEAEKIMVPSTLVSTSAASHAQCMLTLIEVGLSRFSMFLFASCQCTLTCLSFFCRLP